MIAVALIAIALVTLIGVQAQSVAIASGSRFDTMASLLAQWKLTDVHVHDFEGLQSSSGDFGELYPQFSWKIQVEETRGAEIGLQGTGGMLKTVDVTVLHDQDRSQALTVRTVVCKKAAIDR
jgi:general secretion pathway protein I